MVGDKFPEYTSGIKIISEMSREDLINEILVGQRERLEKETDKQLAQMIIKLRLQTYELKLLNEANIKPTGRIFGFLQGED